MNKWLKNPENQTWMYLAIGVITFGHSWTRFLPIPDGPFPPELLFGKMIFASLSAIGWPVYWSVWAWSQ